MMAKGYEVESYFKAHKGCHVTLYQDAKVPSDIPHLNMVRGPYNSKPKLNSCWSDVYCSLVDAKHLICITGWSVWTGLELLREEDKHEFDGTLGELLCQRADDGVEVWVMIWSEYSSGEIMEDGIMGTFDMETYHYFNNSINYKTSNRVNIALTPREIANIEDFTDRLQDTFASGAYTHHQKTIICDTEDKSTDDGRRRLIAYVGGLDLTGGRYDTPEHEIFSTLKTDHAGDFYNQNVPDSNVTSGPREPWHDIHSKVEGPVTKDIFENFIERWKCQKSKEVFPILNDFKINPEAVAVQQDPSQEWNVQVFRSITSDSAVFDQNKIKEQPLLLSGKKGKKVESSIAQAYIQSIRNANYFIYIENQYFMGSAYEWNEECSILCNHTIPAEIVAKIKNKMFAGERFTAYIVIPMWPEGDPCSAPMQAILYWQSKTIEMMYREVGIFLEAANVPPHLGQHPTDWLIFLCPGKRELYGPHMDWLDPPTPGTLGETFRQTMRQMIYVHSKMMIVDDAYIIVGSANINERSMAGTRDSEIAVGCWQPQFK